MSDKKARPWHILYKKYWAEKETAEKRIAICKECEHFTKITSVCKICHCFMENKVRVAYSECPISKWEREPLESETNS